MRAQSSVAALVAAAMTLTTLEPLAAQAATSGSGRGLPAPSPVVTGVPALTAGAWSEAFRAIQAQSPSLAPLKLDNPAKPPEGPVAPQAPASAPAPAAPQAPAQPAAPAAPATPAAPGARETPPALGVLDFLASPGDLPAGLLSPALQKAVQDEAYDRAAAAKAGVAADADWTSAPPELPLGTLSPSWRASEGPSSGDLRRRRSFLPTVPVGRESDLAATEDLRIVAQRPSGVRDLTPDADGPAGVRGTVLQATTGLRRAALNGQRLAWIDSAGVVQVHQPGEPGTAAIKPPMGPAEQLASSQDGRYLYVRAGGTLQRWDLSAKTATVLLDERLNALKVLDLSAARNPDGGADAALVRTSQGLLTWTPNEALTLGPADGAVEAPDGAAPPVLRDAGQGYFLEAVGGSTRVWRTQEEGDDLFLKDVGTVPFEAKALSASPDGKVIHLATDSGFAEWQPGERRYRHSELVGLREAALSGGIRVESDAAGLRVLVTAGDRLFLSESKESASGAHSRERELQIWSENNPMFIQDGLLHIGGFTYPVKPRFEAVPIGRLKRFVLKLLRRPLPVQPVWPPVSKRDWQALNLPTNKKAVYETLKSFALGQDALYIGETGGGKTWMSTMLSQLVGLKLYMVSFTEYTKNQDLIARDTFGEEGKNKTGKSLATVLQWLDDPEDALLVLDEIHKPLEGVAALNNILQNRAYNLGLRRIVGDRKRKKVIATMNPVKPPYKGEPPSGELSSRFGTTIQVNYLPPAEEAALLSIFHQSLPLRALKKLVAVAQDLRRIYPEVLPLPISSRTLLFVAEKMAAFPQDDPVEAFKSAYNPGTIVEDPSIVEAIEKAVIAHDLASERQGAVQKKKRS